LFFGTDIIAARVLEALNENKKQHFKTPIVNRLEVVSNPDIIGKKNISPVKQYCLEKKIPLYQPLSKDKAARDQEWNLFYKEHLSSAAPDKFNIGIVCSFGYMIPNQLIDFFEKGMYVIHPSLLPTYRGASPIQYALLNGDKETGVSILEISKEAFDEGKILFQEKVTINPLIRYHDLALELATAGGTRIIDVLEDLDYYKLNAKPQNETGYKSSKAPKFSSEQAIIHWNEETNQQIFNKYRAFHGSGFTAKCQFNDTPYFMQEMGIVLPDSEEQKQLNDYPNAKPGSIWVIRPKKYKNNAYIKCKEGWVILQAGNLQTKQIQPSLRFLNQYIDKEKIYQNKESDGHYFFK
jgi:methionyl-tRNA formyltransferase